MQDPCLVVRALIIDITIMSSNSLFVGDDGVDTTDVYWHDPNPNQTNPSYSIVAR
jgi:hypothetical protein